MRRLAACLLFLNPILWASYFAVTKEALERFDPAVFATLDVLVALPFGILILAFTWKRLNRKVVFAGTVLGCFFAAEILTEMYALDHTTATNAGFLPSLQGFLAILIAYLVLRRRVSSVNWLAGVLSLAGAVILLVESPKAGGHWYGDLLALLAMVIFTVHVFAIDKLTSDRSLGLLPCFGVELVVAAVIVSFGSLFLADWQSFTLPGGRDVLIILYVGVITTVLPTAIAIFFQSYVSPVYVIFIYMIEPLWMALIAFLYIGETLTALGYLGGGLIVFGAIMNTLRDKSEGGRALEPQLKQA